MTRLLWLKQEYRLNQETIRRCAAIGCVKLKRRNIRIAELIARLEKGKA